VSAFRIVIVEDNPADVLLVRETLKSYGLTFSLEHYSNGEDAARAIATMAEAPNLFLLDLNIPRVPGLDLLKMVRASPAMSDVRTAILTSSQAAEDRRRSEQFGADAYIVKPQSYYEFVTLVGGAIRGLLTDKPRPACYFNFFRPRHFRKSRSTRLRNAASIHRRRRRTRCCWHGSIRRRA
jgi:CheY-like chemotaxis protein